MSELQRAVRASITAHTPAAPPPFEVLQDRKRSRDRRVRGLSAAALVSVLAAGGAAVAGPSLLDGSDRLTGDIAGAATPTVAVGPPPVVAVEVIPPRAAAGNALARAVEACLALPGVDPGLGGLRDYLARTTVQVAGDENADQFEQCVERLPDFETRRSDALVQAAQARARWEAVRAPDYTFRLRQVCFCSGGDYTVTVEEGNAVRIDGTSEFPDGRAEVFTRSIDDLFDLVEDPPPGVAAVRAQYDDASVLPVEIFVDRDVRAIDDEYTFMISEYRPTPR